MTFIVGVPVLPDNFFQADMKVIFLGGSAIGALLFAMKYWRGESSPTPRWEYLLIPPIRVVRHLHES